MSYKKSTLNNPSLLYDSFLLHSPAENSDSTVHVHASATTYPFFLAQVFGQYEGI